MKNLNLSLALVVTSFMITIADCELRAQSNAKLTEPKKETQETVKVQEEKPFSYVEQMPEFEGGQQAFMQFITKNLKYPKASAQGTTFASFIVEKDGSISDIEIVKSDNAALDKEIIRVLKLTNGKWQPGKQNGRTVKVKLVQPVKYTSSNN